VLDVSKSEVWCIETKKEISSARLEEGTKI